MIGHSTRTHSNALQHTAAATHVDTRGHTWSVSERTSSHRDKETVRRWKNRTEIMCIVSGSTLVSDMLRPSSVSPMTKDNDRISI